MLWKNSVLEGVALFCFLSSLLCIILYIFNLTPISGLWFPVYGLVLFIISLTWSFRFVRWLLQLNKPIKYSDIDDFFQKYPSARIIFNTFLKMPELKNRKNDDIDYKEYDTNELSIISTVLERKLVSSWYIPYISQEIGFPFACKQILDQMISKAFQICNKIETKEICVDTCGVVSMHLNEYKKALMRNEKAPHIPVEAHYKKSHLIFNNEKKLQAADHCVSLLRIILKELVPWELWDTPHSELLVRILSKKLDTLIDTTITDPVWLNNKILEYLNKKVEPKKEVFTKEVIKKQAEVEKEIKIEKEEVQEFEIDSAISVLVSTTVPIVQMTVNSDVVDDKEVEKVEDIVCTARALDVQSSPVMRQRRGRQRRNEVKIYDRIIEGSVKTWETDMDLQCISLGQDLLASLDGEITLSRLWEQEEVEGSPNPPQSKSPQPLWFGEEDTIDMELTDSSPKEGPAKKENSPKPTDVLLKDLQNTVHSAKSKIGDLQVEPFYNPIDVARKPSGDEAAGMMEGLLDFGIAGLKKGLRLTGLSDDNQDKDKSPMTKEKGDGSPPFDVKHKMVANEKKSTLPVIQKDENETNTVPTLVKQHRVTSQDSVPFQPKRPEASQPLLVALTDSPEPQYEDANDLSTSIAKLRSLLQQRAECENNEEMWWQAAEETRGRTNLHHSSKPIDTATLADEYDMNSERNTSPNQTSNNMQRLFHRTVTGVFNSLRGAVGVEDDQPLYCPESEWSYVTTGIEQSVGGAVARLAGSRRVHSHVEAALEPLCLNTTAPIIEETPPADLEEWCNSSCICWSAITQLLSTVGVVSTHVTHRIATLVVADICESIIISCLDDFTDCFKKEIFATFEKMADDTFDSSYRKCEKIDMNETCDAILGVLPPIVYSFGVEAISNAVKLTTSSFSHKDINKDVIYRILDIAVLHYKKSATARYSSFDN